MVDRELDLAGELQSTSDEAAALDLRLTGMQRDMQILLAQLNTITHDPEAHNVSLHGVNPEKGGFSISGTAESHGDVLRYAGAVRDSGRFGDARITGLEGVGKEAGGEITFRILASETRPPGEGGNQASSSAPPQAPDFTP